MSLLTREELVGQLTKVELEAMLSEGIFPQRLDWIPWDVLQSVSLLMVSSYYLPSVVLISFSVCVLMTGSIA